jgi:hypothetical protein
MKARCNQKSNKGYPNYGGRGIKVCKEWSDDFTSFMTWSMENGYNDELKLDRIDNDGGYEPLNCRWTTQKVQSNNTRFNRKITIDGVTKTLAQWVDESPIKKNTIFGRIYNYNWPIEKALKEPLTPSYPRRKWD